MGRKPSTNGFTESPSRAFRAGPPLRDGERIEDFPQSSRGHRVALLLEEIERLFCAGGGRREVIRQAENLRAVGEDLGVLVARIRPLHERHGL